MFRSPLLLPVRFLLSLTREIFPLFHGVCSPDFCFAWHYSPPPLRPDFGRWTLDLRLHPISRFGWMKLSAYSPNQLPHQQLEARLREVMIAGEGFLQVARPHCRE